MSYHQTNCVLELITQRLIRKHEDDYLPWKPANNTNLGRCIEIRNRQLRDELLLAKTDSEKDQIAIKLTELDGFQSMINGKGWYCFYCGHLNPDEVTFDEKCCKCGSVLPKSNNE